MHTYLYTRLHKNIHKYTCTNTYICVYVSYICIYLYTYRYKEIDTYSCMEGTLQEATGALGGVRWLRAGHGDRAAGLGVEALSQAQWNPIHVQKLPGTLQTYINTHVHICIHIYIFTYTYIYTYVNVQLYICMYILILDYHNSEGFSIICTCLKYSSNDMSNEFGS